MSASLVLDASAAVRMVVDPAAPSLAGTVKEADSVVAPWLFAAEVANAIWKYVRAGVIPAQQAALRVSAAQALCHGIVPDMTTGTAGSLLHEALHEACRLNHPVYDLVYVVLARRTGATLASCDRRLADLASGLGVPTLDG